MRFLSVTPCWTDLAALTACMESMLCQISACSSNHLSSSGSCANGRGIKAATCSTMPHRMREWREAEKPEKPPPPPPGLAGWPADWPGGWPAGWPAAAGTARRTAGRLRLRKSSPCCSLAHACTASTTAVMLVRSAQSRSARRLRASSRPAASRSIVDVRVGDSPPPATLIPTPTICTSSFSSAKRLSRASSEEKAASFCCSTSSAAAGVAPCLRPGEADELSVVVVVVVISVRGGAAFSHASLAHSCTRSADADASRALNHGGVCCRFSSWRWRRCSPRHQAMRSAAVRRASSCTAAYDDRE